MLHAAQHFLVNVTVGGDRVRFDVVGFDGNRNTGFVTHSDRPGACACDTVHCAITITTGKPWIQSARDQHVRRERIEINSQCAAGVQAPPIVAAAQSIVSAACWAAAKGVAAVMAVRCRCTMLSAQMQRFERERPGLPAIAINSDAATLTAIALDEQFSAKFSPTGGYPRTTVTSC